MKTKLIILGVWAIVFPSLSCLAGDHFLAYSYNSKDYTAVLIECAPLETGELVIPRTVAYKPDPAKPFPYDYKVVGIGKKAFGGCFGLTSIELPTTIQWVGEYAFSSCSKLIQINIPSKVKIMPSGLFSGCSSLEKFSLGSNVTLVENAAFGSCTSLTRVQINSSKTEIKSGAFSGCTKLTSIACATKIPPVIEAGAFPNYNATVYVPEDCEEIYRNNSEWNKFKKIIEDKPYSTVITVDGIRYGLVTKTKTAWVIGYTKDMPDNVHVPEVVNYNKVDYTVTGVYKKAFQGCTALKSILLPKNVRNIRPYAFFQSGISSIILPDSIKSIEDCAFTNLESVRLLAKTPPVITLFSFGTFNDIGLFCADLKLPICVPTGREKIYQSDDVWKSFTDLSGYVTIGGLKYELTLSSKTAVIAGYSRLLPTELKIPDNVKYTDYNSSWSYSVKGLKDSAFEGCQLLTKVTIPYIVQSIGRSAFSGCNNLLSVSVNANIVEIPDYTFDNCTSMTSVTLPNKVRKLGRSSFSSCKALKSIVLPASLETIGEAAFLECESFSKITIPKQVTAVCARAFNYCENLKNVYCMVETPPETSGCMIANKSGNKITLHVPNGYKSVYESNNDWNDFNIVEMAPVGIDAISEFGTVSYSDGILELSGISSSAILEIYTLDGKQVRACRLDTKCICDLNEYSSGIYIVRVKMGDKTTNIKIAK